METLQVSCLSVVLAVLELTCVDQAGLELADVGLPLPPTPLPPTPGQVDI